MLTITVTGDRELMRRFERLPLATRTRLAAEALEPCASQFADEVERRAPRKSGALARSFRPTPLQVTPDGATISVSARAGWTSGKTFYGAFQELGWRVGKRLRRAGSAARRRLHALRNRARRRVPGKFFVAEAFDARAPEALVTTSERLRDSIEREAARG